MQRTQNDTICYKGFVWLKNKLNFFGDESSLHGVGYVLSMSPIHFLKRIFWFTILVLCCLGAASVLEGTLDIYSGDVVSYSVETNYLDFDTPFPAVTICEQVDNVDYIKSFLKSNNITMSVNVFKDLVNWKSTYCPSCKTCKINSTCIDDFPKYVGMARVKCSQLLTNCSWKGQEFHCCDRFHSLETEFGRCFSFNSLVANNEMKVVTVNRIDGLGTLMLTTPQSILMRVHAPDEAVSASMDNVIGRKEALIVPGIDFKTSLKAEQTISDISVITLSPSRRGCLYKHERPAFAHLWPSSLKDYSYNTCIYYCRAVEQMELCNCTHHFMPRLGNVPVCGIKGMACLTSNSDELLSVDCECPMACEEILYKAVYVSKSEKPSKAMIKRGTIAYIQLAQLPALRVRRQVIRGMLGLVVDVGGLGGVFFGASLLSVIEIYYIFFIRRGP